MKDILKDIIDFLHENQGELSLTFQNDQERELYALNLLDGIRFSSLQKTLGKIEANYGTEGFEHLLTEALRYKEHRKTLDFFNQLDEKSAENSTTEKVQSRIIQLRRYPGRILAIAATVALCITAGWWFWSNTTSSSGLYTQYYNIPAHEYLMRGDDTPDPEINQAFTLFDQGHYEEAIPLLDELYKETGNDDFLFYKSIALIETSNITAAESLLNTLSNNHPQNMEYRWYYALALLQSDQENAALTELQIVAGSDHFRSSPARKLIRDLNK